jgi:hypothetical protein
LPSVLSDVIVASVSKQIPQRPSKRELSLFTVTDRKDKEKPGALRRVLWLKLSTV